MSHWTTTQLNVRYHWKAVLGWAVAVGLVGWLWIGTATAGVLENPNSSHNQVYVSGIGLISGWVCDADQILIGLGDPYAPAFFLPVSYGIERTDTAEVCGDTDNGFVTQMNWNKILEMGGIDFGSGQLFQIVSLWVDGELLSHVNVTVTTFGQDFLAGKETARHWFIRDFPEPGDQTFFRWDEALQNFVISGYERAP